MPKVPANGIDIFHEVHGSGDPLLLIAGFGCDHTFWIPILPALAAQYRVVVFDNRGTGQTSGVGTSLRQLADDAAELLDALGLPTAHVAGHSMGGMIAQELALAHPRRIRSLSLLSTAARVDARGKEIIESWGELPRLVDARTGARLSLPWVQTSAFYAQPGAMEQLIELIVANPYPPSVEGLFHLSRACGAFDATDRLGAIDCPTLVLVGREDILIPVAFSEQLARGIRGAELVILEKQAHGLVLEAGGEVAGAMLDFLKRQ